MTSLNSSANSETGLLANTSPTQSIAVKSKHQHKENKENKLQRFGGAIVVNALNGGTFVFGKIKSLWSHNNSNIGLNILADNERLEKKSSSGSRSFFCVSFRLLFVLVFIRFPFCFARFSFGMTFPSFISHFADESSSHSLPQMTKLEA